MHITICKGCGEHANVFVTSEDNSYCLDCAKVYGLECPPICTRCKRNVAFYQLRYDDRSLTRTKLCEDCFDRVVFFTADYDTDYQWETID